MSDDNFVTNPIDLDTMLRWPADDHFTKSAAERHIGRVYGYRDTRFDRPFMGVFVVTGIERVRVHAHSPDRYMLLGDFRFADPPYTGFVLEASKPTIEWGEASGSAKPEYVALHGVTRRRARRFMEKCEMDDLTRHSIRRSFEIADAKRRQGIGIEF